MIYILRLLPLHRAVVLLAAFLESSHSPFLGFICSGICFFIRIRYIVVVEMETQYKRKKHFLSCFGLDELAPR